MTAMQPGPRSWLLLITGLVALPLWTSAQQLKPYVLVGNFAGDNISIVDPTTDTVVGDIGDLEVVHGIETSPDGSRIYATLESEDVVAVVDWKSRTVTKRIPVTANPNNLAQTRDGKKLFVAINAAPGGVDVIDTATLSRTKHIPLDNVRMHNTFTTPDGKFVVAGSQDAERRVVAVIDTKTDEALWSIEFQNPRDVIRPISFITNPDGSTKWMLVELNHLLGFAVVDFTSHQEIRRVAYPPLGALTDTSNNVWPNPNWTGAGSVDSIPCHGIAVAPDGKSVWISSRVDSYVYALSVPEFEPLGGVMVAGDPWWLMFGPNGRKLYVSTHRTDMVSVIDTVTMREMTRIPVGQLPRRSQLALLLP